MSEKKAGQSRRDFIETLGVIGAAGAVGAVAASGTPTWPRAPRSPRQMRRAIQPAPSPISRRPSESRSRVATSFASIAGWR